MGLSSSLEQRIGVHTQIFLRRGYPNERALAEAYAMEGLPPPMPVVAEEPRDLLDDLEELHFQLACERKRADACSMRARILLRENRDLREAIETGSYFVGGRARGTLPPWHS